VDQGGGLQSVVAALGAEVADRQAAHVVVDGRDQGVDIPTLPRPGGAKQLRDIGGGVAHGRPSGRGARTRRRALTAAIVLRSKSANNRETRRAPVGHGESRRPSKNDRAGFDARSDGLSRLHGDATES